MRWKTRLAQWLRPDVFSEIARLKGERGRLNDLIAERESERDEARAAHAVVRAMYEGLREDLEKRAAAVQDVATTPIDPAYEAMVALQWGNAPMAATATRARVRLLQQQGASKADIVRAVYGHEVIVK